MEIPGSCSPIKCCVNAIHPYQSHADSEPGECAALPLTYLTYLQAVIRYIRYEIDECFANEEGRIPITVIMDIYDRGLRGDGNEIGQRSQI